MEKLNADNSEPTLISFCAGYGGLELGIERAIGRSCRVLAYSEIESFVIENLVAKMESGLLPAAPIWSNLRTFPAEHFSGMVDILCGGFPCQPFSHAGKRAGDEDPRHLFPYIKRAAEVVRPRFVFLENVEGLLSAKLAGDGWHDPAGTPVLLHVLRELERINYRAAWGIFSASEVGAPHQRKRVFILAYDKNTERELTGATRTRGAGFADGGSEGELAIRNGIGLPHSEPPQFSAEAGFDAQCDLAASGGEDVAHSLGQGPQGHAGDVNGSGWEPGGAAGSTAEGGISSGAWPARPGEAQYGWEPPRVSRGSVGYRNGKGQRNSEGGGVRGEEGQSTGHAMQSTPRGGEPHQTQPPMGGNLDGPSDGLDFPGCASLSDTELEEIYSWMDKGTNRTDELRMCGNGVCPDTAEKAFRVLYGELFNK